MIDKFFKDRAEYAERYMDEMKDYMSSLMSYFNSVISGVTTLLDHKIDKLNKEKETIVETLQKEQEAAEERYQAEIDALQEQMDALDEEIDKRNEIIDGLNDQVDAINDANAARDRSIQLQKAEYDLQRQMHQRTKLVYTGEVGQMRYERDEAGLRDAQENLKDAQDEIEIAKIEDHIKAIEKEIEGLEKQKKALEEQQKEIQKLLENTTKYYEKLIKEQEKFFESLIKPLEETKEKWQELAEVEEISKAWSLVSGEMESLGFTVEDVLNDVPGAFETFKARYLQVLKEMHSGDEGFIAGVEKSAGKAVTSVDSIVDAVNNASTPVSEFGKTAETSSGGVSKLADTAATASSNVDSLATSSGKVSENVDKLSQYDLTALKEALEKIAEYLSKIAGTDPQNIDTIKGIFNDISTILNGDQGVVSALDKLQTINFETNLKAQFEQLLGVIGSINQALNGVGGSSSKPLGAEREQTSTEEGGNLVTAIENVKEATKIHVGTKADDDGDTVIGHFNQLGSAVETVATEKIGVIDDNGDTEVSTSLIGTIGGLKTSTEIKIPQVVSQFDTLLQKIDECTKAVQNLIAEIDKIHLPSVEGIGAAVVAVEDQDYTGTAIVNRAPRLKGTAKFGGDWGVKRNETSLVGELGTELILDSKKGTFRTVGENGPEIAKLHRGDVVYNHLNIVKWLYMVTCIENLFNCWNVLRDNLTTTEV